MKLNDFRTVHRSTAEHTITIEWSGVGCSGQYDSWLVKEFTFELDENQQKLVDEWIKEFTDGANMYSWKLTKV